MTRSTSTASLLVLGGAEKTVPLVRYAHDQGYQVILCDRNADNPCRQWASRFEQISTTDRPALREVIRREQADGVVSFGSDLMAMVAAELANEFGLPGNPPDAVETLVRKDRFRSFLREHDFPAPCSDCFSDLPQADDLDSRFSLPVMVKPVDGAGSIAVRRLDDWEGLAIAFADAKEASRDGLVIIEDYLERDHEHMIGGDIFVHDGEVVFWGLLNSHRHIPDKPFLPTGTSYPVQLSKERVVAVQSLLQDLVTRLKLSFGGFNVELMFTSGERPHVIELAPRNGGNRIPELLGMATGFDFFGALVESALGQPVSSASSVAIGKAMSNYMLHSDRPGSFCDVAIHDDLRPNVLKIFLDVSAGDSVRRFDRAPDALGTFFLEFETSDAQQKILSRLPELVSVRVTDD
jgi:biotin carboxylase